MARIQRAWCSGRFARGKSQEDVRKLEEAGRLLATALEFPSKEKPAELLRQADAQQLLAETLAALDQMDRARAEFFAASDTAVAALKGYDALKVQKSVAPAYLRGVSIVRQAFVSAAPKEPAASTTRARQARLAADLIQNRLRRTDLENSARVGLLVAAAGCSRQLEDEKAEEQFLNDALRLADRTTRSEKNVCAEILVRLAELNDSQTDTQRQLQAAVYYAEAASLYSELLSELDSEATTETEGEQQASAGSESQYLLQLQLIHTRLENWDQAIAAAERFYALRRDSSLPGVDPNLYRAETALGSLHAKAARSARDRHLEAEPDFGRCASTSSRQSYNCRMPSTFGENTDRGWTRILPMP